MTALGERRTLVLLDEAQHSSGKNVAFPERYKILPARHASVVNRPLKAAKPGPMASEPKYRTWPNKAASALSCSSAEAWIPASAPQLPRANTAPHTSPLCTSATANAPNRANAN